MLPGREATRSQTVLPMAQTRWNSQYMTAYLSPTDLPAPRTPGKKISAAASALSSGAGHVYAWKRTDPVIVRSMSLPGDRATADAAAATAPAPSATAAFTAPMPLGSAAPTVASRTLSKTPGKDRTLLRSRLDRQLDMYSTAQMRNLLAFAGDMALGQKA